ncbi:MAG TPA: alpha/beta family hydrolase [Thermoanaerobaculia bacterium]|nr:alpha/beta family hydrolase [Thermoanaerobaculia bacterium]HXT49511.1 alpha/beta family hydrolase [Thermoanaerobaculia bacterium]
MTDLLFDGPADAPLTIALAHGAGAPMDSGFMNVVARGLAARGLRVARFEFPYMAKRRSGSGGRGAPDRPPVLEATWLDVIATLGGPEGGRDLVIGGKSMGGRIASHVADRAHLNGPVRGLVCMGYPFHPPGQPEKLRTAHLADLRTPTLILQGTRDDFGNRDDVAGYALSPAIRVHWLEGGDHSFKPLKASGRTERQNVEEAIAATADFALSLLARR